jgi:hypothetical protein
MRKLAILLIAVMVAAVSTQAHASGKTPLEKVSALLTTGGDDARPKREAMSVFAVADVVTYIVTVRWQPIDKGAGWRHVAWRWYIDGQLVSEVKQRHHFRPTPFEMWARLPGTSLGAGRARVELLIDGQLFDAQDFEIRSGPAM